MSDDLKRAKTEGRGIPVRGNDIDTDRIIPARFMKCVTFEGLGEYAFYDARFGEDGSPKGHPFDDPSYKGGSILLVNKNFGCGSSREHAPQALQKFGITAIVGESFAEIFAGNCTSMGIPTVKVSSEDIHLISDQVERDPEMPVKIDLDSMLVIVGGKSFECEMPASSRTSLREGSWDTTAALLANKEDIEKKVKDLPYLHF